MSTTLEYGCGWIDNMGHECGDEVEDAIILRDDRLVAGRVLVCTKHKAEYNKQSGARRVALKSNQKTTTTPKMRRV